MSRNGQYHLVMQDDGDLVQYYDYHSARRGHWSTATANSGPGCAIFRPDGHVDVITLDGRVTWSTRTAGGGPGDQLVLQDDANLVLYVGLSDSPWERPDAASWAHNRPLDWVQPGQRLLSGWFLRSQEWNCTLEMQHDGNLVLYDRARRALWASATDGQPNSRMIFQEDSNVVIYDERGGALWSTDSGRTSADLLRLEEGCRVFLYENWVVQWQAPSEPEPVDRCCFLEPQGGPLSAEVGFRGGEYHYGVDYSLPMRTPVEAGVAGTVELVYTGFPNCYANGCTNECANSNNLIRIRADCDDPAQPGNQLVAWYMHIDDVAPGIVEGTHVEQGQHIALSGNSGCSSGPHLHLEVASVPRGGAAHLASPAHIDPTTRYCR